MVRWGSTIFQFLFTDLNNDPAVGKAAREAAAGARDWLDRTIAQRKANPSSRDDVLGPDDDITLFEYVKRNNRETGPALVGIELADAADLPGLLERMAAAPSTIEHLSPESPLTRFLV